MDYCPKCIHLWDKKYNKCPFCGYEDNSSPFEGSVFDILDDMAYYFDGIKYEYPKDNSPSDDAYSRHDNADIPYKHICQNSIIEGTEDEDYEFDKKHFKAFSSPEDDPYARKDITDEKPSPHICQNDILGEYISDKKPETALKTAQKPVKPENIDRRKTKTAKVSYSNSPLNGSAAARAMAKNSQIKIKKTASANAKPCYPTSSAGDKNGGYPHSAADFKNYTTAQEIIKSAVSLEQSKKNKTSYYFIFFVVGLIITAVNPFIALVLSSVLLFGKNSLGSRTLPAVFFVLSILALIIRISVFI